MPGVDPTGVGMIRYNDQTYVRQTQWYKGYFVRGSARSQDMNCCTSIGSVYAPGRHLIEIREIHGIRFATREQAERHGLELAKNWVDEQTSANE